MRTRLISFCFLLVSTVVLVSAQSGNTPSSASGNRAAASQQAVLDRYCISCHNDRQKLSGLSLERLDLNRIGDNAELWEKVVHKVRAGMQPPNGKPRPDT